MYRDLDTESVEFVDPPSQRLITTMILHLYHTWTRDSLRITLLEHLRGQGYAADAEAALLVEEILDCLQWGKTR